jgi:hypothetical protein
MDVKSQQRQVASLLEFLSPGKEPPSAQPEVQTVLNVPFRVGIAFVPDRSDAVLRLAEAERQRLAERVRTVFRDYPFIRAIEIVPSNFLKEGGGFDNLDRVVALLRLDVVVLVSFDQVQHAGANRWSFLYWTGVGAYLVEGEHLGGRALPRRAAHVVRAGVRSDDDGAAPRGGGLPRASAARPRHPVVAAAVAVAPPEAAAVARAAAAGPAGLRAPAAAPAARAAERPEPPRPQRGGVPGS